MRLENVNVEVGGSALRFRFDARLTVMKGVSGRERAAFVAVLSAVITGQAMIGSASYVDASGRRANLICRERRVAYDWEDGSPVARLPSIPALVTANDLGLDASYRRIGISELEGARASLSTLTNELHAAFLARQVVEALGQKLRALDQRLSDSRADGDRREYALLLADCDLAKRNLGHQVMAALAPADQTVLWDLHSQVIAARSELQHIGDATIAQTREISDRSRIGDPFERGSVVGRGGHCVSEGGRQRQRAPARS